MSQYRQQLPQLSGMPFLTDSGLESTLVFHEGVDLPHFAAYQLLDTPEGDAFFRRYFEQHIDIARRYGTGFLLESVTWRANPDWADRLGHSSSRLAELNERSVSMLAEIRADLADEQTPMVISGCVGPRGDGYSPDELMTPEQAAEYHATQINTFAGTDADLISAITMTNTEEAIGIVQAATSAGMPVVISFTVETDGRLPTGQALGEAIDEVDDATDSATAYFMVNCAHPTHFGPAVGSGEAWINRIGGLRANASKRSHAELDEATELDDGNPEELGAEHRDLLGSLPAVNVLGGCCGTDHRHVEAIARCCFGGR